MEKMRQRRELDVVAPQTAPAAPAAAAVVRTDWRDALPVLNGTKVTLREPRRSDAPSLLAMLATEEVARFMTPPPSTVESFERFIAWAARQRAAGAYACFAVTLKESDTAVGIFHLRSTDTGFATAEWSFALGAPFWGTGIFERSAALVMEFAFETVGVHRLEARAAVRNGRGNSALRKIRAVQEGVLRKSFLRNGEYLDQMLWTVLDEDWRAKAIWGGGKMILH